MLVDDVERVEGGESFFWRGRYDYDLNVAHTEDTQLGVFADFEPKLSEASRAADILFLANIQPDLQRQVRAQCEGARFSALDSMNLWIDTAKDSLEAAIAEVDCLIVNDAEIRELTDEANLARAARAVMGMGPRAVVAKQGEYGAALFTENGFFALPGFPLEDVKTRRGGDSFAGGFLGYLDSHEGEVDDASLRRAMGYGTVLASFNVEEFGTERVARLTREEIDARFERAARDDPVRTAARRSPDTCDTGSAAESDRSRRGDGHRAAEQHRSGRRRGRHRLRFADGHRQPHRQDLRAADHRRHGARHGPSPDQGRRGRIRDAVL